MTTTMSTKISAALVAATLTAGWVMPAAATELPVPPPQKAASVAAPAKKVVRHGVIRLASAAWLPALEGGSRWPFPMILGVAY